MISQYKKYNIYLLFYMVIILAWLGSVLIKAARAPEYSTYYGSEELGSRTLYEYKQNSAHPCDESGKRTNLS